MRVLQAATALLLSISLTSAGPTPRDQPLPSSNNVLEYVDSFPALTSDKCSAVVSDYGNDPYLAYPNAKIIHQPSGTIDCQTRLRLQAPPGGYGFSINWASLSGYLQLERGAYIERINVSLAYQPGGGTADVATARNLYGRSGTGYDGRFNLSIPVTASASDGKLGTTGCHASSDETHTWLTVNLFVSLAHEEIEVDDAIPHYGTVGGNSTDKELRLALNGAWQKC